MSLFSFLAGTPRRSSFAWNHTTIYFDTWADDAYGQYTYLTRDRSASFIFELKPVYGGTVRIFILQQPSYGRRASDGHSTHRIDIGGRPYICIADHLQPTNVPDALSWAVSWAEQTARYIRTGYRFS